jgi:hypothetical protein
MSEQSRYAGMTVNERLFDAGLLEAYQTAARARDRVEMIRILENVVDDAPRTADTVLRNPVKYGL